MFKKHDKGIVHVITGYKEPIAKYKILGTVHQIDWDKPLSSQIFKVNKGDTVVGFSLGAVLACLIAQKYKCRAILCSMTDINSFSCSLWLKDTRQSLNEKEAKVYVKDILGLKIDPLQVNSVVLRGELEKDGVWKGDVLVPKTGHSMNKAYINAIVKLL